MKQYSILFLVLVGSPLFMGGCQKSKSIQLESEKAKQSYAIGFQLGQGMREQRYEIDPDAIAAGIADALASQEPRLQDKEIQEALMNMRTQAMDRMQEEAERRLAEGRKFLEENKTKEGVKTTASGLQYKVIAEGKGKPPKNTERVKVHYRGTLLDGTEFDSSYKRNEPAEFGVNAVIRGWTEALQLMNEGAKWTLYIPAELAYGSIPRPKIPANSVLIFEVELLEVVRTTPPPSKPLSKSQAKPQPKKKK